MASSKLPSITPGNVLFHSNPRIIDRRTFQRLLQTSLTIAFVQFVDDYFIFVISLDGIRNVVLIVPVSQITFFVVLQQYLCRISRQVSFFECCAGILRLSLSPFSPFVTDGRSYIIHGPFPVASTCCLIEVEVVTVEGSEGSVCHTIHYSHRQVLVFEV